MLHDRRDGFAGQRILVVEDEYALAFDLERALKGAGATVVGPAPTIERALALVAASERLDGAVLDVNLQGEMVFPVADALDERGVPFVFTTGYEGLVRGRYRSAPRLEKPTEPADVLGTLARALPDNRLLSALAPEDAAELKPGLERASFKRHDIVVEANRAIEQIVFPTSGLFSAIRDGIEVGVIGREGLVGLSGLLGSARAPYRIICQVPGEGWRMRTAELRGQFDRSPTLRGTLLAYANAFLTQVASTAVANARGTVEQRLARWLLIADDRLPGRAVALTHEFLAQMLGVRRAGVTVALGELERAAVVRTGRGIILILDRPGLERLAGSIYAPSRGEVPRLDS